jgi:hypothetical protein
MDVSSVETYHCAMVGAIEAFNLLPTSMSYIYVRYLSTFN